MDVERKDSTRLLYLYFGGIIHRAHILMLCVLHLVDISDLSFLHGRGIDLPILKFSPRPENNYETLAYGLFCPGLSSAASGEF